MEINEMRFRWGDGDLIHVDLESSQGVAVFEDADNRLAWDWAGPDETAERYRIDRPAVDDQRKVIADRTRGMDAKAILADPSPRAVEIDSASERDDEAFTIYYEYEDGSVQSIGPWKYGEKVTVPRGADDTEGLGKVRIELESTKGDCSFELDYTTPDLNPFS